MNADVDKIIYMGIPISISTKINKAFFILLNHCRHWFSKYGFVATLYFGNPSFSRTVFIRFHWRISFWLFVFVSQLVPRWFFQHVTHVTCFFKLMPLGAFWGDGIFPHLPKPGKAGIALIAPVKKSRTWIRSVGCLVWPPANQGWLNLCCYFLQGSEGHCAYKCKGRCECGKSGLNNGGMVALNGQNPAQADTNWKYPGKAYRIL